MSTFINCSWTLCIKDISIIVCWLLEVSVGGEIHTKYSTAFDLNVNCIITINNIIYDIY